MKFPFLFPSQYPTEKQAGFFESVFLFFFFFLSVIKKISFIWAPSPDLSRDGREDCSKTVKVWGAGVTEVASLS